MTIELKEIETGKPNMSQEDVKERQGINHPQMQLKAIQSNVPVVAVCCFLAGTFHRRGTKNQLSSHGCHGTQKGCFC